jgi:hypothetical protein
MTRAPTTHVLGSTDATISPGLLDPSRPPAPTIDPGDIVSCPNTWTQWGNQARYGMSFADREPLRRQFPNGPYSDLGRSSSAERPPEVGVPSRLTLRLPRNLHGATLDLDLLCVAVVCERAACRT